MTYLANLIDGASGDQVSVAVLLRQAKVLAARLRVPALGDWADQELTGYSLGDGLPSYRGPFSAQALGHFSGPFNSRIQNAPIPPQSLPEKLRDVLFTIEFRQGVSELEHLIASDNAERLATRWPADAIALINGLIGKGEVRLYPMMGLVEARIPVSPAQVRGVLDAVRVRLLDLALALEGVDSSHGQSTTPVVPRDQAAVMFYTVIYGGGQTITMSPSGILEGAGFKKPQTEGDLLAVLKDLGVSEELREELRVALRDDAADGAAGSAAPGRRTRNWLAKAVSLTAMAGGQVAVNGAGGIIATVVMSFFS